MWAATTKDKDYIQMTGMKYVVNNMEHRKEFITGNLSEFMAKGVYRPPQVALRSADTVWQSSKRSRDASGPTTRWTSTTSAGFPRLARA